MRLPTIKTSIICVVLLVLVPLSAPAQDLDAVMEGLDARDADQPWIIDADRLRYDDQAQRYVAEGNVLIQKGRQRLSADAVEFDRKQMRVVARGNVRVSVGQDELTGNRVELDLEKQTGVLTDGYLYLRENNFRVKGDRIEKLGENTYEIENASLTTCEGEVPDWRITGSYLKVTLEGYGRVKHATIRAREVPFFYLPYFIFPAMTQRQSGLLIPEFGRSSRWGYFINQPLFWAISDSADATFYYHWMSERGHKFGGEFRYFLTEASRGSWMADYLNDRKIDDGSVENSADWGYVGDGFPRPNKDRYWLRGGHYQPLPLDFFSRLELDVVSDQDYLTEFKDGYSGYDDTEAALRSEFGRQLDLYTDPVRLNRLDFHRIWSQTNLDIDFRWNDNVINRRFSDTDDTLQRLPAIAFDLTKQRLLGTWFFGGLQSSYNYFYRQEGDRGQRLDIFPRFSLPVNAGKVFTVEPAVGLRETLWYADSADPAAGSGKESYNRELYDFQLQVTSDIQRVFTIDATRIDRLKHTIKPQVTYSYVPEVDQSDLPDFDEIDRVVPENRITYSINNFFLSRSRKTEPVEPAAADAAGHQYRQLSRFKLEQSYDIAEARRNDPPPGKEKRPFSPITAELDVFYSPYVTLDADAAYDVYENRLNSGNIGVNLSDKRNDNLYVEYRFTRNQTKTIRGDLTVQLTRSVTGGLEYEENILSGERLNAGGSILYRSQCWAVGTRYVEQPSNRKIEFWVELTGLGELKGSF
jgi:LPS-assembly protein